jgi:hypothetical protein
MQITGLNTPWRRPTFVFGIDGLQALHLAMAAATAVLTSARPPLIWLGESGDLGLPHFLPWFPRNLQDRITRIVDREVEKAWRAMSASSAGGSATRRRSR